MNVPTVSALDLITRAKSSTSTTSNKTERVTNWFTTKIAKVSGAVSASTDNFGQFYDTAKADATSANEVALAQYAKEVADRINERNAKIAALLG